MQLFFWFLALLCVVVAVARRCEGCLHEERRALLDIYTEFSMQRYLPEPPVWRGRDCCRWEMVTCNSRTGRVMALDLSEAPQDVPKSNWIFNASLFLPFQDLFNLSLNISGILGCRPGFEVWSDLRKLEVLDLSGNSLNDSSIASLAALSSLRSLSLSWNSLNSVVTIQKLSKMKLDSLDLSYNSINGRLSTDICNMENLQELYLNDNVFFGGLPSCIGNLTSLRILDLSHNPLTLRFPFLNFANLTSLVQLSLSDNNLEGVLFLSSFLNNSQLKYLDLSGNSKRFHVQTENPVANLSAQLHVLVLPNCNLNSNSSVVPSFLLYQHAFHVIDMSNNNLRGYFPSWLIENNVNLSFLNLHGNSFSGPPVLPSKVHHNLLWLDASCNRLRKLPMDINITLPNLIHLNLSRNYFQGFYPSAFSYMGSLDFLDISYNNIVDNIGAVLVGSISNISALFLSGNSFHGSFPQHVLLPFIYHLVLNDNNITGNIPKNICISLPLTALDVSSNKLTGSLPTCLFKLPNLAVLNLRGNYLVGAIPSEFCLLSNLFFLDLSKNNLAGQVQCLPNLHYLHLSENRLSGSFPIPLSLGTDTRTIDLRRNQFSGIIPSLIDKAFPELQVSLLGGNMFEGTIPNDICHLKSLRLLDLSCNQLSGKLPSCLCNMGLDDELYPFIYTDANTSEPLMSNLPSELYKFDVSSLLCDFIFDLDQEEFTTKSRQDYYKGNTLSYMSGLDFSSNKLEGPIPESIDNMQWLRALNFSNNSFSGPIPKSLSN